MKKLPVFEIFFRTLYEVWIHKLQWLQVMFAPWVVLLLAYLLKEGIYAFFLYDTAHPSMTIAQAITILGNIPLFYILTFIAEALMQINGVRYAFLGEGRNHWWVFHCNRRLIKMFVYFSIYFLYTLGCIILIAILSIAALKIGAESKDFLENMLSVVGSLVLFGSLGVLGVLGSLYILIRSGLFFIFIAIDTKKPLRASWHLLKGNVWRSFWLIVFLTLTSSLCIWVMMSIMNIFLYFIPLGIGPFSFALSMGLAAPLTAVLACKSGALVYQTLSKETTAKQTKKRK